VSEIGEIAFRILFRIVAETLFRFVAYVAFSLFFVFFRRTGDFLIDLATLDYFRDNSHVPLDWKPLNAAPDWSVALLGFAFWCAFAAAAYLSWPWLASL
jgi:hypothetical protein